MATTTLSKGESYTFTRTGAVTTLVGSSDHAHGIMRVSNNLYMSASGIITHTIDSAGGDSNIHFKTNVGSFKLGYDNGSSGIFNLRTGTNDYAGLSNATTVFQVSSGDSKMYVPNGLHVSTGLVVTGSTIFRPTNIGSDPRTTFKSGSSGLLGIGWNGRNGSAGYGEIDFYSLRGSGATATDGGGFAFYDLPRPNDTGGVTNATGTLICRMFGPTTAYNTPQLKVEGRLEVNGALKCIGVVDTTSDKRLKQDILPIENALNKILTLNGVTYNWNKEFDPDINLDDHNHIGLLAQDVEKIIPQIVHTDTSKNQLKSLAYTELIPVLIEAIKEQQTQINELKNKLKDTPYG